MVDAKAAVLRTDPPKLAIDVRNLIMFTLTGPAVEVIRTLTTAPGLAEDTGLRIAHQDTAGSLALSISPGPEVGDEIIETEGVRIFLHVDAAAMLDGKSLDAQIDDDGVVFQIGLQAE
jgi:Fe-S cluster assembly iron-binding protein IscA